MSNGPVGSEKAPADAEPAFIEAATNEQAVADARPAKLDRPAKNAPKADVQAWARGLGHSDEGTVKEIFARVDAESGAPAEEPTPEEAPFEEKTPEQALAEASPNQLAVAAATFSVDEKEEKNPGKVDLGLVPLDKLPIASKKGELLLRVEQNPAGIVVLTVSNFGTIGIPPVTIRAEQAGDLDDALKDLRKQAKAAE